MRTFLSHTPGPALAGYQTSPQIPGDSQGVLGMTQGGRPPAADALFGSSLQETDWTRPSHLGQIHEVD